MGAGYAGTFDLELIGPRIEAEGYETAVPRAVRAVERSFGRLEARKNPELALHTIKALGVAISSDGNVFSTFNISNTASPLLFGGSSYTCQPR